MTQYRRISVNTSLKNAFIFDEELDSLENVNNSSFDCQKIKDVHISLEESPLQINKAQEVNNGLDSKQNILVKQEPYSPAPLSIINEELCPKRIIKSESLSSPVKNEYDTKITSIKIELSPIKTEEDIVDKQQSLISLGTSVIDYSEEIIPSEKHLKIENKGPDLRSRLNAIRNSNKDKVDDKILSRYVQQEEPQQNDGIITRAKKRTVSDHSDGSSFTSERSKGQQKRSKIEREHDPIVLKRRQKQIDFGKNTLGYDNYTKTVPKYKRKKEDPVTPDKTIKYSRRGWDGLIKKWRLQLHKFDPD
ncbi:uncharacterized protein LOC108737673 [Agrilus planipennis]|uniref:Uncharacterized protein LOC108737673 n=1 Tax=Agrilus planipennis TaxID=224129 RepID=A0A1W4X1C9_AGRPL|nr:uncharacterized protein LOC108737673 [Agrilus planipennis]